MSQIDYPRGEEPGGENYWEGVRRRVFEREAKRVEALNVPLNEIRFKSICVGSENQLFGLTEGGVVFEYEYDRDTKSYYWKPLSMSLKQVTKEDNP